MPSPCLPRPDERDLVTPVVKYTKIILFYFVLFSLIRIFDLWSKIGGISGIQRFRVPCGRDGFYAGIKIYLDFFGISLDLDKFLTFKNEKYFSFSSLNRNFALSLRPASKIGGILEIKINPDLFCISLDLRYLCKRN